MLARGSGAATLLVQPTECVMNERLRAPTLIGQISRRDRRAVQHLDSLANEARSGVIVRKIETNLQITNEFSTFEMPRPPIQPVQPQGAAQERACLPGLAKLAQHHH